MLAACTILKVSLLLICQQVLVDSSGIGPCFPLAGLEDCANFTPTPEENDQYSANHF
jgi:hypothetical protein